MSGTGGDPRLPEPQPLVAPPGPVRVFSHERRAGLAEVTPTGRVRLDTLARWTQDVAWADVEDAGLKGLTLWLVRRTRMRVRRFPRLDEPCTLSTYVSGTGRMWAERRTDVRSPEHGLLVEVSCTWVHIDPERMMPSLILPIEYETWSGPQTRIVKARLGHPAAGPDARPGSWRFRAAELDLAGHVNNTAYFTPLDDELGELEAGAPVGTETAPVDVEIEYRSPALAGEHRWLADGPMRWLHEAASGEPRASVALHAWPA